MIPAANGRLTSDDVRSFQGLIATASALIVQLETPIETVAAAIQVAQQNGIFTVLDPAPAPNERLPQELMTVDIISPNQSEGSLTIGGRYQF